MSVATTTLEEARTIVSLVSGRLPGGELANGTDNLSRVDYAIKAAGDEFVRRTRCTLTTDDSLTLTAGSEDLDTSSLTDFHPSRLVMIEVKNPTTNTIHTARWVNYQKVRESRDHGYEGNWWYPYTNSSDQSGTPELFSWRDESNAIVAPLPGLAWEVLLTYWAAFTSWTIGTATPNTVTLNIPDDMIHGVLHYGVRAYLDAASSPASADLDRRNFEAHIIRCRGQYARTRSIVPSREDYI